MSHFTVLVIGDNPEQQLAPYQENNMGDCPKEYLQFFDKTEELLSGWESETITRIQLESGELVSPIDERFRVPGHILGGTGSHNPPKHLKRIEVPVKQLYQSFDDYARDFCGYEKDSQTGKYGYWENPNAKWDWYQLGGRWTGFFLLKQDAALRSVGTPGILTAPAAPGRTDQCFAKDVDWYAMNFAWRLEAQKDWNEFQAWLNAGRSKNKHPYFDFGVELRNEDFESYDEFMVRRATVCTFAVLKDGVWCEKGEMGWFACVSNAKDPGVWQKQFQMIIESLQGDELLSLYDCHI